MVSNFLYSFNAVAPIFLIVLVWLAKAMAG